MTNKHKKHLLLLVIKEIQSQTISRWYVWLLTLKKFKFLMLDNDEVKQYIVGSG